MIPKVFFIYSRIYDMHWREIYKENYPSQEDIIRYISRIEKVWKKHGNKILKKLSYISGLKWKEDIKCYVVGRVRAFSEPLTIGLWNKDEEFIDNLVHELIHNLLRQNDSELKNYWINLYKRYPKTNIRTRVHIPVHAIHKELYLKMFTKKRLDKDIRFCKTKPDYKKAWDIVLSKDCLKEIKKYAKSR